MASGLSWWLDQVGRFPLLSPTQELQLARAIQSWLTHPDGREQCPAPIRRRGLRAREKFVQSNLRLVVNVAKRFRRFVSAEGFDDLVSAGNIGLMDAVERFDPSRGYRFSTYACFWIQMRVTAHLERAERTIRLPTTITYRVSTIPKVLRRLLGALGREPTRAELAAELQMSEEEVDRVFLIGRPCASLDAPAGILDDGTSSLADLVAAPEVAEDDEQVIELRLQLGKLTPRARQIVEGVYGLGCAACGISTLANSMGLSRQVAARILREAEHDLAAQLNPACRQLRLIQKVPPVVELQPLVVIGPAAPYTRRRREKPDQLVLPLPKRLLRGKKSRRGRKVA